MDSVLGSFPVSINETVGITELSPDQTDRQKQSTEIERFLIFQSYMPHHKYTVWAHLIFFSCDYIVRPLPCANVHPEPVH